MSPASAAAARAAIHERSPRALRNRQFRERALTELAPLEPIINGDHSRALPQVLNLSFIGIDAEAAIVATKDLVAISNGSACLSQSYERSHVLVAMQLDDSRIDSAVRMSWCHLTPDPDWATFVSRLSPLLS